MSIRTELLRVPLPAGTEVPSAAAVEALFAGTNGVLRVEVSETSDPAEIGVTSNQLREWTWTSPPGS